ncbi:hypothetical protein LJY18_08680 [Pseudomonas sp. MMS21-TM103]|uniref:hypothetical protein n=1 Tax=Pseudomonas sp. MMS21 TM103 TaxID=2886506 RepID=UPI001EDF258C|nr:hypothetical protein [Pseudomonas sp. MMS21 TM103]MCG4453377.1 hypothetical protein [Pseudomonas sp. MMS21 TM103]
MKSIISMTALTALLIGASVTSAQAGEPVGEWLKQAPQMILAEGGSAQLMFHQERMRELASQRDMSRDRERFVQLIKEQPTAAGSARGQQEPMKPSEEPRYKSLIEQDRALYGPH